MKTCDGCGTGFNVDDARDAYRDEFDGELDYDEDTGGGLCGSCAGAQSQSNINSGRAIQMMNGDEDYDDDFVQKHL